MTAIPQIGDPVFVPKGHPELGQLAGRCLAPFKAAILTAVQALVSRPGAEGFLRAEGEILRLFMLAASHVTAGAVAFLHGQQTWVAGAIEQARERHTAPLRHRGHRSMAVRFLGGAALNLGTPYLSEPRSGKARDVGRRGEAGGGVYPVLRALGIAHQATPALYSEVARHAVRAGSFEEAREALAQRGIGLDGKTVRRLALHVGGAALAQRTVRAKAAELGLVFTNELEGRRIVVLTDGGRMRPSPDVITYARSPRESISRVIRARACLRDGATPRSTRLGFFRSSGEGIRGFSQARAGDVDASAEDRGSRDPVTGGPRCPPLPAAPPLPDGIASRSGPSPSEPPPQATRPATARPLSAAPRRGARTSPDREGAGAWSSG